MIRNYRTPINRWSKYVRVVVLDTREIVDRIADEDVRDFLKFRTGLAVGDHYTHIVNLSAYEVQTDRFTIMTNDTLCRKSGRTAAISDLHSSVTCPGCLAIGKGIAVRDLTDEQLLSI